MTLDPHVSNARRAADVALKKSTKGGGLKGWAIRRVFSWFRRRLKKPSDLGEIARIAEVIISILNYLKGAPWIKEKHTQTIDIALKAFQELRSSTVGG